MNNPENYIDPEGNIAIAILLANPAALAALLGISLSLYILLSQGIGALLPVLRQLRDNIDAAMKDPRNWYCIDEAWHNWDVCKCHYDQHRASGMDELMALWLYIDCLKDATAQLVRCVFGASGMVL
jgi:hypothetical protein